MKEPLHIEEEKCLKPSDIGKTQYFVYKARKDNNDLISYVHSGWELPEEGWESRLELLNSVAAKDGDWYYYGLHIYTKLEQ